MKRLLVVILVILIPMFSAYAAEKSSTSWLENIDIEKYQQEVAQKNIDEYYKGVIGELGTFYGHYKVLRYEMSQKTGVEKFFKTISGGENYKYMSLYKASLKRTAILLARVAWPDSYSVGGSIRQEQIINMEGMLPHRAWDEDDFLKRIKHTLTLPFPAQPDSFYTQAMKEIKEIGERFFILEKSQVE